MKLGSALLALVTSYVAHSTTTQPLIRSFEVYADGELDLPAVLDYSNLKIGDPYSPASLERWLLRLSESGEYQGVKGSFIENTGTLTVYLRFQNKIGSINITLSGSKSLGVSEMLNQDIRDVIGLSEGDSISIEMLDDIRSRIKKRLQERGYENSNTVLLLEESSHLNRVLSVNVELVPVRKIVRLALEGFSREDFDALSKHLDIQNLKQDFLNEVRKLGLLRTQRNYDEKVIVVDLPNDSIMISERLAKWATEVKEKGFYDFNYEVNYIEAEEGLRLRIAMKKGPRYNLQFKNAVAFWERELRESLVQRNLRLGTSFSVNDSENSLRKLYRAKGFADFTLTTTVRDHDKKHFIEREIIFQLNEGRQYFLGPIAAPTVDSENKKFFELAVQRWLRPYQSPFRRIYFEEATLRATLPELQREIRNLGFLEARIIDLKLQQRVSSPLVRATMFVQMGPRYKVGNVTLSGNIALTNKELDRIITLRPGEAMNPSLIDASNRAILRKYRELGFMDAEVATQDNEILQIDYETREVNIDFKVTPGPQVRVGKIIVEGLQKTKEKVVRREARHDTLRSGTMWDVAGQETFEQRLLGLGIFGSVTTRPTGGKILRDPEEDKHEIEFQEKDLKINLSERAGGALEFGPGFRTDKGIIGVAELNYRNLGGWNRGVLLRSQVSAKVRDYQFLEQRYSFTYLEPWLANLPLRLRFNASYGKDDQTVFFKGRKTGGYNSEESSFGFGLDQALTRHLHWYHNLYTISLPHIYDRVNDQEDIPDTYRIATMGTTFVYDNRDNFFNPTKGFLIATGTEYSSPEIGSDNDANFFVARQELTTYLRTSAQSVIALSGSYTRLWALGYTKGIPETKRLTLGGRSTIRSLSEGALGRDGPGVRDQQSMLAKIEYRQPIFFDLGVAYFFDTGTVETKGRGNSGWHKGLGVGFRYATPVGPVALDFAFNVDQREDEEKLKVQFSIGNF